MEHVVIGHPFDTWKKFPEHMFLRSRITSTFNPFGDASFIEYLSEKSIPLVPDAPPISRSMFLDYAEWFLKRNSFAFEKTIVTHLEKDNNIFLLSLENGKKISANHVVMATGIQPFAYIPDYIPSQVLASKQVQHTCRSSSRVSGRMSAGDSMR